MKHKVSVLLALIVLSSLCIAYIPPPPLDPPSGFGGASSDSDLNDDSFAESDPLIPLPSANQAVPSAQDQAALPVQDSITKEQERFVAQEPSFSETSSWVLVAIIALAIVILTATGYLAWRHFAQHSSPLSAQPLPEPITSQNTISSSSPRSASALNDQKLSQAKLYVAQLRGKKISDAQIATNLRTSGWPQEYIDAACKQ